MEEENSEVKFAFNFHPGFDLYVAVRCGQKEAFDKLEATHAEDPLICGYMAMSLVRSENSTIPKDINRARDLSKHFIPLVLEMVDRCTTSYFADALYILGFCYQEGEYNWLPITYKVYSNYIFLVLFFCRILFDKGYGTSCLLL